MKIGAKQRKIFIIGFGVIAVLVLSYTLVTQQLDAEGTGNTIEDKKELLRKYMGTIELKDTYEHDLDEYKSRLQENRQAFLEGTTIKNVQAELTKVITDFAEKDGIEVTRSSNPKEEKIKDTLYKVSAQIQTQCSSDELVQFLTDIRNYYKFLTVDSLYIQITRSRTRPTGDMRPTITVSGYFSAPENETAEGGPSAG